MAFFKNSIFVVILMVSVPLFSMESDSLQPTQVTVHKRPLALCASESELLIDFNQDSTSQMSGPTKMLMAFAKDIQLNPEKKQKRDNNYCYICRTFENNLNEHRSTIAHRDTFKQILAEAALLTQELPDDDVSDDFSLDCLSDANYEEIFTDADNNNTQQNSKVLLLDLSDFEVQTEFDCHHFFNTLRNITAHLRNKKVIKK